MSNSRGSPSSHPPACCWGLIWSEQVLYIGVSVTWHSWFVPRNKESNCKVMKLSPTHRLSKNTYTKMLHTNCHCCLKYQSHELFDMCTIEWFLALFTLNNGYLILVDRFTSENYMQLEHGVMWHTCNLSLWPHRCLTRKTCRVRSLSLTAWPGNVLVIVLSHLWGNNYLTANFGRENKFVSKCSWWATESPNDLWSRAISLQDTLQTIPRGNLVVL